MARTFEDAVARIAANVKRLRKQRGWTQEELASRAELSTVGVAVVEGARTNVTITTLCQLAAAFEVDVGVLLRRGRAKSLTTARER